MQNDMRNRLANLLYEAVEQVNNEYPTMEMIADYLIENGVMLLPCEPLEDTIPSQVKQIYDFVLDTEDLCYSKLDVYENSTEVLINAVQATCFQRVRYFIEDIIEKEQNIK